MPRTRTRMIILIIALLVLGVLVLSTLSGCDVTTTPTPTATNPSATATDELSTPTATSPAATSTATDVPPTATDEPPTSTATSPPPPDKQSYIWIAPDQIKTPLSPAIMDYADSNEGPNVSDQNNQGDAVAYAAALACHATEDPEYCTKARTYVMDAIGTEEGGRTLALGRNLTAYIIAADLVGLPEGDDSQFKAWLDEVRTKNLDGRTLISTHEDRPNNWGTHSGAARIAIALYLDDEQGLGEAAAVFKGYLGDRLAYNDFNYGSLTWQSDPDNPVGINPAGATIEGHNVDGVMPDDQRRGGSFTWPPFCENYAWEALQGTTAQAWLLHRAGEPAFWWENSAVLRAVTWLYDEAECAASGDDTGTPYAVDFIYDTDFASGTVNNPGKNGLGFYDWQFSE